MTLLVVALALAVSISLVSVLGASALTLDPTFGTDGTTTVPAAKGYYGTWADAAVERPGGGLLVAGAANPEEYWDSDWLVTAFDANGNPDRAFGNRGRVMLPDNFGPRFLRHAAADAIAIQADGKILVGSTVDVATNSDFKAYEREIGDPECNCTASRAAFAVIRLLPNGSLDPAYGRGGLSLIRSVVRSWDEGLNAELSDIALDPNGSLLVHGSSTDVRGDGGWYGHPYGLIYRLTADGWIDKSFGVNGRALEYYAKNVDSADSSSIGVSSDGAVTTVSRAWLNLGKRGDPPQWIVRRLTATGAPDTSYGLMGSSVVALEHPGGYGLVDAAVAPDGSVTLAGTLYREGTQNVEGAQSQQSVVARVTAAGAMDASFGVNGVFKVPKPRGARSTTLHGFGRRADGSVDLAEIYEPARTRKIPWPASVAELRSISSTGQLVADPSGESVQELPALKNSANSNYFVGQIISSGGSLTLIGGRESRLATQQSRIMLMRVKP